MNVQDFSHRPAPVQLRLSFYFFYYCKLPHPGPKLQNDSQEIFSLETTLLMILAWTLVS